MTVELFMFLFGFGSIVSALLTQAVKKAFKELSSNIIALIDAVVVGVFGTGAVYILMGIEWSFTNIVCLALMSFSIWLGSMVGYDKVMQTIGQLKG